MLAMFHLTQKHSCGLSRLPVYISEDVFFRLWPFTRRNFKFDCKVKHFLKTLSYKSIGPGFSSTSTRLAKGSKRERVFQGVS